MNYASQETVRSLIRASGLTNKALAARLGLHIRSISHYIAGTRRMPARTAADLARIVARERAKSARGAAKHAGTGQPINTGAETPHNGQ